MLTLFHRVILNLIMIILICLKKILKENLNSYDIIHDNQSLAYELLFFQKRKPLVTTIHHPISKDLSYQLNSTKNIFLKN